jgi:hypothetical protein
MRPPRNWPRNTDGTPNCLGFTVGRRRDEKGRRKSSNEESRASQRVLYPGDQTCPVKGPDFLSGTPDWTCLVWAGLVL